MLRFEDGKWKSSGANPGVSPMWVRWTKLQMVALALGLKDEVGHQEPIVDPVVTRFNRTTVGRPRTRDLPRNDQHSYLRSVHMVRQHNGYGIPNEHHGPAGLQNNSKKSHDFIALKKRARVH